MASEPDHPPPRGAGATGVRPRLPRRLKKLQQRLMASILTGLPHRAAALLRQGADPRRPDSAGTTPLYLASVQGEAVIARMLLAAGADPDLESGTGEEGLPLCAAACWGHAATVRVLLAACANPNLREDHGTGRTPVEWASLGDHHATLALLREAGAG